MGQVIGMGQLRNHACDYLERVAGGEAIDVVRRGKLVARIVSLADDPRNTPIGERPPHVAAVPGAGGRVGLDELRARAGRCFDRVAAGETVEVVWRGRLVARIIAASANPMEAKVPRPVTVAARPTRLGALRTGDLDRVAAGETIELARRGKVVARIVSVSDSPHEHS